MKSKIIKISGIEYLCKLDCYNTWNCLHYKTATLERMFLNLWCKRFKVQLSEIAVNDYSKFKRICAALEIKALKYI